MPEINFIDNHYFKNIKIYIRYIKWTLVHFVESYCYCGMNVSTLPYIECDKVKTISYLTVVPIQGALSL